MESQAGAGVSEEEATSGVNNEGTISSDLDVEVLLQTLSQQPPAKRSKPNQETPSVLPNFGKLRSETYKLYKWDIDGKWKCRICG